MVCQRGAERITGMLIDIEVGDDPNAPIANCSDFDAIVVAQTLEFNGGWSFRRKIEDYDVRINGKHVPDLGELPNPFSNGLGQCVIVSKSFDMMVQRIKAHHGKHPGLAHGAAELLLDGPRVLHEVVRTC